MNQEHHNKIIIVAGILVLIIVAIFGVAAIRGKNEKTLPLPVSDADSQYQKLIKSATAPNDYSITDPEIQKLIKSASAPKNTGTMSNREALIRAATAISN